MTIAVLRADARCLPLPDASVDLVVTSPPFYQLRSYQDGGKHYDGQLGSEATPGEYIAALLGCTREWVRVLKSSGSLFVELGDKYVADNRGSGVDVKRGAAKYAPAGPQGFRGRETARQKSLMLLPHRYALGCIDELGLILRAEIAWHHVNGLPESVTDRVRRAHSVVFHFTRLPRYYSAVDEIREGYAPGTAKRYAAGYNDRAIDGNRLGIGVKLGGDTYGENPLGKLPGSVWDIPSQPLTVPPHLGVDHFAAFPMELPRRIILGWSPPGICTECGAGRQPVFMRAEYRQAGHGGSYGATPYAEGQPGSRRLGEGPVSTLRTIAPRTITGYACACPQPDAPTRPAVVLDPFGGTGTTALVASVLGRHGITADLSADYCRLALWRTTDPGERAKARQVPKPPPVPDGQDALFTL